MFHCEDDSMRRIAVLGLLAALAAMVAYALSPLASWTPADSSMGGVENRILYVREEEKLARDVYLTLYETWGLEIFARIAESEQRHMNAVATLLEKYGLEDPVVDQVGVFTNSEIQELYNQLVEWGGKSLDDALLVGAYIEEKDIIDLAKVIEESGDPEVDMVIGNLIQGSMNHLRAFTQQYESMTGEEYTPQLLPWEEYESIVG